MSDRLYVYIEGKVHSFWTKATIARSIERGAYGFQLTLTDSFENNTQTSPRVIKRGQAVEIFINKEKILTGYIDDVNPSYSLKTHTLMITGRSKVADLIDCSTNGKQFKVGMRLRQIVSVCCLPFGINVTVDPSAETAANEPMKAEHMLDVGQPIWEFLEELARIKAVLLVSDNDGNLVITRAGSSFSEVALVLGENILGASGTFSNISIFSEYTVNGQQGSTPLKLVGVPDKTQPKGTVKNSTGRYRPYVISSDNPVDAADCKTRAQWQKNVNESRAESVVYTVQGWRQKESGSLWNPNVLVPVKDDWMDWHGNYLMVEARISLDDKGSTTEIRVMPEGAFGLVPKNEEAVTQKGFIT